MSRCVGCGALLQCENQKSIGYIPKEKINKAELCERCFRILHYNDLQIVDSPRIDLIKEINKNGKLVFFLIDLLNINEESIAKYKKITIPKIFILSKCDFIPKYINKNNIRKWLTTEYGIKEEIIFISALKSLNINYLKETMQKNNVKEAYLAGYTNSGKSTLLNAITKSKIITTSYVPNTTLDFIPIELEKNLTLIDTPGFLYQKNLYKQEDVLSIKKINPKNYIKPLSYQLKKGASIVIEDLIRIENISNKCNIIIYMSNLLQVKRVYDKNDLLRTYSKIKKEIKKNQDLVLKGIGFINCKSECLLNIYIKDEEFLEFRNSFFER